MRRLAFLLLPAAAACGTAEEPDGNAIAKAAVQTANLTGLYEGETAGTGERSRMCILDRGIGNTRFGLVLVTPDGSCSGIGSALRSGNALSLSMAGDEACEIDAAIAGASVAFPAEPPAGCAYYCAPGVSLAGARFEKVGGTAEDTMRARDLVGDPLCG